MEKNLDPWLYDAFITYRRSDGSKFAVWLRRHIQDYRLPPTLLQGRDRLRVYVDTAFERANKDFWANNVVPALNASRHLIVVLTPEMMRRRADGSPTWAEREIEAFLDLSQKDNILVVLAKGHSDQTAPPILLSRYPQISIVDMREFSAFSNRFLLSSTLRDQLLTILGTLYDVDQQSMPLLRREIERRARIKTLLVAITTTVIVLSLTALSVVALFQRNEARSATRQAEKETSIATEKQAEAERQAQIALSRQLAATSQLLLRERDNNVVESTLLAVESVRRETSLQSTLALRTSVYILAHRNWSAFLDGAVSQLAISSKSIYVAAGDDTGLVLVWRLTSHKVAFRCKFAKAITSLSFTPDGKYLAATDSDGSYRVIALTPDDAAGEQIMGTGVKTIAFSPDGSYLLMGNEKTITFCSLNKKVLLRDGRIFCIKRQTLELPSQLTRTVISPDGAHVGLITTNDIYVTSSRSFSELSKLAHDSQGSWNGMSMAFSPDGRHLVEGSQSGTMVWDLEGFTKRLLNREQGGVIDCAYSHDGKKIVTTGSRSQSYNAMVWDAVDGIKIATLPSDDVVKRVGFSNNDEFVITAGMDGSARLWESKTWSRTLVAPHSNYVNNVAISKDDLFLATSAADGQVAAWDLAESGVFHDLTLSSDVNDFVQASDGAWVLSASRRGVFLWTDVWAAPSKTLSPDDSVALALSEDGLVVVAGMEDGSVVAWETKQWRRIRIALRSKESILAVAVSSKGRWVAWSCSDGSIRIKDILHGEEVRLFDSHPVQALQFGPEDSTLIVGRSDDAEPDADTRVEVWDWRSAKVVRTLNQESTYALALSSNRRLLAGGGSNSVKVWDTKDFKEIFSRELPGVIRSITFNPTSSSLAFSGSDREIHILNVDKWDEAVNFREPGNSAVIAINLNAGDKTMTAAFGSVIRLEYVDSMDLVDAACKLLPRNLTNAEWREHLQGKPMKTCANLP